LLESILGGHLEHGLLLELLVDLVCCDLEHLNLVHKFQDIVFFLPRLGGLVFSVLFNIWVLIEAHEGVGGPRSPS